MRTTITIDDDLYASAKQSIGEQKPSQVVAAGLRALVAQESAKRLRALAGTAPDFEIPTRSRRLAVAEPSAEYSSDKK
jgi:Arc/MetJ family transcription regulator